MLLHFVKEMIYFKCVFDFYSAPFTVLQNFRAWSGNFNPRNTLLQERKKFAGKLSRLQANLQKPQKFSTMNDLHYNMVVTFLKVQYKSFIL